MTHLDPIFTMTIIAVITLFVIFVLYQLGMLLMETRETVDKINTTADEVGVMVDRAKGIVEEGEKVFQNVLNPLRYLGAFMEILTNLVNKSDNTQLATEESTEDSDEKVKKG